MTVSVDGWAWLAPQDMTPRAMDSLRRSLHVIPRRDKRDKRGPRPIRLFCDQGGLMGIPREHPLIRKLSNGNIEYRVSEGSPINVTFNGRLRDDQPEATEVVVNHLRGAPMAGGIMQAIGGWGKTVWTANVIATLGVTTLVMVNRTFLMNQWRKRLAKFLPDARVGIIQQDKCQIENVDVAIGMIHSLAGEREYPPELYSWAGLIVPDEVHVLGAETWAAVAPRFNARWRLGLSATPRRSDGADDAFWLHIGKVLHVGKRGVMQGKVRRVWTDWAPVAKQGQSSAELPDFVVTRKMIASRFRNEQILDQLLLAMDAGRKILVFSGRRKHLETLHEMLLGTRPGSRADFYVGGRKQKELDEAEEAQVIWSTYKMAKEALDIPEVDTEFIATPVYDVEQAYYRAVRKVQDKLQPVIVDFIDSQEVEWFRRLWKARERFYKKMKALPY